jgi:prepilin-type N-terminal cleavage/methylation domain-containing protein
MSKMRKVIFRQAQNKGFGPMPYGSRDSAKNTFGFTLVELLLTITILSILTIIGMGQFRNAQGKAKDAQRKSDLGSIQRALEFYYTDIGSFPDDLPWNGEFSETVAGETMIYMKKMPEEEGFAYAHSADNGAYALFSILEMEDPCDTYEINGSFYCYGVSSPNTTPEEIDAIVD